MDGWMTCDFTSFSTEFRSYQDNDRRDVERNGFIRKKQYKPKTRPEIEFAEYVLVEDREKVPEGFQRLAPSAQVCVKPSWLHSVLASLPKKGDMGLKKGAQRKRPPPEDSASAVLKRLIDGFYEPWELEAKGGTTAFKESPIFESLKLYATQVLQISTPRFTRIWNSKMSSSRYTVKNKIIRLTM